MAEPNGAIAGQPEIAVTRQQAAIAEAEWLATLEVVITRRSTCPTCGYGTEDTERSGFCRVCGGALVGVEPVSEDVGVISGMTKPCGTCGYPNDPRIDACKRCGASLAEVEPTEEQNTGLWSQIAEAWRRGWTKGP